MTWLRNNPTIAGIGGLVGLAVVAYLAFGVFGIQTAFIDDKVSEENPFAAGAGPSGLESDETDEDLAAEMNEAMEDSPSEVESSEAMPGEITELSTGSFEGRSHPAEGTAVVITDGSQTFLRFEDDFATDNGPDLNVYLTQAPITAESSAFDDEGTFIDLGDMKGNIGSQNYEVDPSIDLTEFNTVVIWCVRFGVAFGAAPVSVS